MTSLTHEDVDKIISKKRNRIKYRNKDKSIEDAYNYLKIWAKSPSFNDVNSNLTTIKVIVLGGVMSVITLLTFMVFKNMIASIITGFFIFVFFIIVFHEELFSLNNFLTMRLRSASKLTPFESIQFWTVKSTKDTLFYTNIKDLTTVGLRIFQVKTVAENIKPNYKQLFTSLSEIDIPFTYQIIQRPLMSITSKNESNKMKIGKSARSLRTIIYFCFFYDVKGMFSSMKLRYLLEVLDRFSAAARNVFDANFRHFDIEELMSDDLIKGFKTIFFQSDVIQGDMKKNNFPQNVIKQVLKSMYIGMIIIISYLLLERVGIPIIIIMVWCIGIFIAFIFFFWREFLFGLLKKSSYTNMEIQTIDPFEKISFYYFKRFPDCLFASVDNKLLIGTKIFNLTHSIPPLLDSRNKPIARMSKFIQAIIPQKIPLSFTYTMSPMRFATFEDKAWDLLNLKTQTQVLWAKTASQQHDFMSVRKGIWRTIFIMSLHEYLPVKSFKMKYFSCLEENLYDKERIAVQAFKMNIIKSHGEMLKGNKLISGFLLECLKNKHFRMNGTHLHYLMYHGAYLAKMIKIFPEFKKGLDTRIASEFNTPFDLKNFITIGHTINTEVYREENEAGFTLDQLNELLITGGSNSSREMLMMRIVMDLIETRTPSIVFDYTGKWSKLLNYFRNSRFEDEILYFILGKSFMIDPIKSDIHYDKNNMDYLKYMIDVLSLVFQKDDRIMNGFKQAILKADPNLELEKDSKIITDDIDYKPQWEKDARLDSVSSIFSDFIQQDLEALFFSRDPDENITVRDFIEENYTVIINLSQLKDLQKKIFATFIILSKIIHYIENQKPYCEKIIFIPHIEIMFNSRFLDKHGKQGKIDLFFEPLKNAGLGIVVSSEAITSLHPHVYTFFTNYAALRTTERQEIKQIVNLMNFSKLHGTGIYSSSRNETFQESYLMNMKDDEIIVRRSDINQPFPVKLDVGELVNTPEMEYDEIVKFMREYGYDFDDSEKRIIQQARKTIFKKDFDNYFTFIDEIINFMDAIKKIDKIGNLYRNKLKEDLMSFIYSRAVKIAGSEKKKREIRNWRNDIFNILIKHSYLVENHPKQASGSESIRTSYSVGLQYERALKDYYDSKRNNFDDLYPKIVSKETEIELDKSEKSTGKINEENRFIELLGNEMRILFDKIFRIYRYLKAEQYINAQEMERELLPKFFNRIYMVYNKSDELPSKEEFDIFLSQITSFEGFPINDGLLKELIKECKIVEFADGDIERNVSRLYKKLNDLVYLLSVYVSNNM
ncbi:MAG: hypothetical protein ACFFBP_18155 [Promethearchaeota archaeon]